MSSIMFTILCVFVLGQEPAHVPDLTEFGVPFDRCTTRDSFNRTITAYLSKPPRNSGLRDSVVDELRRSKARVYLAQGTADEADSVIGFDVMRATLLAESRNVTAERIEGGDHGFDVKGGHGGVLQKVFGNVVEWFLR